MGNVLYYGDNLDVLRRHVPDASVDLVYLDPPFKSDQDYNVLFAEQDGSRSAAQIKAFEDTWTWDEAASAAYHETVEAGGGAANALVALHGLLGGSDLMAYLAIMAPRLIELRRVLKPSGSIYLHCDPTASHYLKILMDAIFGAGAFRNEIIWCYRKWSVAARQFARNHDVVFFYSKAKDGSHYFMPLYVPVSAGTMKRWKGQKQQAYFEEGVRKATSLADAASRTPMPDWWDISIINPNAEERLGFPTQKPGLLLERIIQASSREGEVVLDPFCGCGTTLEVAHRLRRSWIGIDVTHLAIGLIRHRLVHRFGDGVEYAVEGEPVSLPDARSLALDDRFQFQCWATGLVGARIADPQRGADKGIDGQRFFHDEVAGKTKQVILSVKSGGVGVKDVRELRAVVEREKAAMGALLTLEEPTRAMRTEAADVGFYTSPVSRSRHPRIQILTIDALLKGAKLDLPESRRDVTFRKAPAADTGGPTLPLFDVDRGLVAERKDEPVPIVRSGPPRKTLPARPRRPKRRR